MLQLADRRDFTDRQHAQLATRFRKPRTPERPTSIWPMAGLALTWAIVLTWQAIRLAIVTRLVRVQRLIWMIFR